MKFLINLLLENTAICMQITRPTASQPRERLTVGRALWGDQSWACTGGSALCCVKMWGGAVGSASAQTAHSPGRARCMRAVCPGGGGGGASVTLLVTTRETEEPVNVEKNER